MNERLYPQGEITRTIARDRNPLQFCEKKDARGSCFRRVFLARWYTTPFCEQADLRDDGNNCRLTITDYTLVLLRVRLQLRTAFVEVELLRTFLSFFFFSSSLFPRILLTLSPLRIGEPQRKVTPRQSYYFSLGDVTVMYHMWCITLVLLNGKQ